MNTLLLDYGKHLNKPSSSKSLLDLGMGIFIFAIKFMMIERSGFIQLHSLDSWNMVPFLNLSGLSNPWASHFGSNLSMLFS